MGGGCVQRVRPVLNPPLVESMKLIETNPENVRSPSYLIERQKSVVNVEGGILKALRHERTGELLEAHDKVAPASPFLVGGAASELEEKKSLDEAKLVEQARVALHRLVHCEFDGRGIVFGCLLFADVGPVDRKMGHDLDEGPLEAVQGNITPEPV